MKKRNYKEQPLTRKELRSMMAEMHLLSRSLDSFIEHSRKGDHIHVKHPAFENLYVRHTERVLGGRRRFPCLDLANMRAHRTGHGAFTRLVARLRRKFPRWTLFVECVMTDRFCEGLLRMGFLSADEESSRCKCFYMLPVGAERRRGE